MQEKPWTDDWVFQNVYFCNVHREDDKVTKWIRSNYTPEILGDYYDYAIVAARIFNWPETLGSILYQGGLIPYNAGAMISFLEAQRDRKEKIWGGAYLITTHGQKMSKIDYCVQLMGAAYQQMSVAKPPTLCTLQAWHRYIMQIDGLGSFLAAQIVADYKNTKGHFLANAEDWMSFSAPGPGSLRGLAWYYERDKVTPTEYENLIVGVEDDLGTEWNMQDLQNCLCEFDKYCRVNKGTGRSKRKYKGMR